MVPVKDLTTAAVVVNYRSAQLTVECVRSLREAGVHQVVVVDNASGDGCARLLPADVEFVPMPVNRGYGAAANAGVARTEAHVVFLSNPDLWLGPGVIDALVRVLAEAGVGVAGPMILRPDGTRYPSARTFPSLVESIGHGFVGLWGADNRWSKRYLRTDATGPGSVGWISGAFMAFRRDAFDAVGGFDESYFMFLEEVDICRRLHEAGWDVRYEPRGSITHIEGVSRKSAPYRMIVAHHTSLLRYAWRNGGRLDRALMPVMAVGLTARAAMLSGRAALERRRA
jgi:N-acetylglucosaminyl-diphospho-decaprenol L-rhamnosyltransferase